MGLRATLILAFVAGLAFSTAALAGVELRGGPHYPTGRWHGAGGSGVARGPGGVWRYYGPNYFAPISPDDTSFWDCYAYDNSKRQWVRICN